MALVHGSPRRWVAIVDEAGTPHFEHRPGVNDGYVPCAAYAEESVLPALLEILPRDNASGRLLKASDTSMTDQKMVDFLASLATLEVYAAVVPLDTADAARKSNPKKRSASPPCSPDWNPTSARSTIS